jgi:hypothetical protein
MNRERYKECLDCTDVFACGLCTDNRNEGKSKYNLWAYITPDTYNNWTLPVFQTF